MPATRQAQLAIGSSCRHMNLTRQETEAVIIVSLILALRLLGIFLILPVFSIYVIKYPGATLTLAGVALGIYPLFQSIVQIPFGWASDRIGRKPVILIGLFLLTLGSAACGLAENINQLIAGRILQGSGAIGAVAMAALGDLTRPQVRAQAFTISGIAIGISFVLGFIGGPLIATKLGFGSLFYLLAALSFFSMLLTALFFPDIKTAATSRAEPQFSSFISQIEIRRLYAAVFIVSFAVSLFFFIYPLSWTEAGIGNGELWKVYLVILLPAALFVFPYVRYAEKRGMLYRSVLGGWIFITLSFMAYSAGGIQEWILYATGAAFFFGHTLFQSLLPTFLSQRVSSENRGSATGFYNLAGFFGSSLGGMLAGGLYHMNHKLPLAIGLVILIGWAMMIGLPKPPAPDSMK